MVVYIVAVTAIWSRNYVFWKEILGKECIVWAGFEKSDWQLRLRNVEETVRKQIGKMMKGLRGAGME